MAKNKKLTADQTTELLVSLKGRFLENMQRHNTIEWEEVESKLKSQADKLWTLHEMERTGGEPDVVIVNGEKGVYTFIDCAPESLSGRRKVCYDREGLESRKQPKPENNAMDMVAEMGVELLTEELYRRLQETGAFDLKTSSWILTPDPIRKLGGALFGDRRYDHVFIYHNGAQSYYGARGFRAYVKV